MQLTGVVGNKKAYRKKVGYSKGSAFITEIVNYFAQNYFFLGKSYVCTKINNRSSASNSRVHTKIRIKSNFN